MKIGEFRGTCGTYRVEEINGAVYYRDSTGRTVDAGHEVSRHAPGTNNYRDGSNRTRNETLSDLASRCGA